MTGRTIDLSRVKGVEFSRAIKVADLPENGAALDIAAEPAEAAALAERFGLDHVEDFRARLKVSRDTNYSGPERIHVSGALSARIGQRCVVTLEPLVSEIDETVNLYYAPAGAIDDVAEDELDPFDDAADPEPYENGIIDLGEAVAQQLSLAIDPYPRSPAATDSEADGLSKAPTESEAQPTHRPFEGLDALMKARKGK